MNCWEILGIDATFDLAAIKTAYAAKAKEWHPEEYPEEFKRLQQAYRTASRIAKAQKGHAVLIRPKETVSEETTSKETAPEEIEAEIEIETEEAVNREEQQHFDYESVAEAELFDYRAAMQADLNDRFFTDFFSIAWNPYLMNNLNCWAYMLKSSPYDELLSSEAFRYNFVKTVCHSLSGWQRKTILFFEEWLQSRTVDKEEPGQKKETDLLCWKLKKAGLLTRLVSTQRCATKEQKELHNIFLAKVERCGRDKSLSGEADVECYLSYYLPFAAQKQPEVKEMYYDSCQGRMFLSALLLLVPLIIGMVVYVNACVVPRENEKIRQEAAQKTIQNQAEELKKYNESFWDDDHIGGEWLREHQEELEQEFWQNNSELFRGYYEEFSGRTEIEEMLAGTEAMGIDVFDGEEASDEAASDEMVSDEEASDEMASGEATSDEMASDGMVSDEAASDEE